jgi:uncharacterized membrane protein HdeD (DUF308 family)
MAQLKKKAPVTTLPFTKANLRILMLGLLTLVVGYIFMAQPPVDSFWSLTLSPLVLMLAYLIIIPYSIFHGRKKKE